MKSIFTFISHPARFAASAFLAILLLACSRASMAAGAEYSLDSKFPWLRETSSFVQSLDLSTGTPSITSLGAFGVGSGYVFALQGVSFPQNKLTNIVGPDYEKPEGLKFLPVWHAAEINGGASSGEVKILKSRLERVTGASIIVSEESASEISMRAVTFAPFGGKEIIRIVSIKNTSNHELSGITLALHNSEGGQNAAVLHGDRLVSTFGDRVMTSFFQIENGAAAAIAEPGALRLSLGSLAPGAEKSSVIRIRITKAGGENEALEPIDAQAALATNKNEWAAWMNGALSAKSSDGKFGDLFDNTLALVKVQMVPDVRGVAVMARYSGMWCRDTFGPARLLLHSGKFDDVAGIAEFYDYATRLVGFRNRYPVDLDFTKVPATVDWESMRPQQGDDPNLLVLQSYYYYRATGDLDFIARHYDFLKRNITGQSHENCRFPFNSDETYQVYVMMAETAKMDDFYTPDTAFAFTMATRAMAEMSGALGRVEDAEMFAQSSASCEEKTEEYYWNEEGGFYFPYAWKKDLKPVDYPFASINTNPLWIGYGKADDEKQRRNVITTAKALMKKNGAIKSAPKVGYYTGMNPGMLLYNFKALGMLQQADRAYTGMMTDVISKTGEFAEAYDTKDRWMNYTTEANIYRPWESSINAEAALYYATGLKYDHVEKSATLAPHLPPGVDWFEIDNLYAGKFRMSLKAKKENNVARFIVTNTGSEPFAINLFAEVSGDALKENEAIVDSKEYQRKMKKVSKTLAAGESIEISGPNAIEGK